MYGDRICKASDIDEGTIPEGSEKMSVKDNFYAFMARPCTGKVMDGPNGELCDFHFQCGSHLISRSDPFRRIWRNCEARAMFEAIGANSRHRASCPTGLVPTLRPFKYDRIDKVTCVTPQHWAQELASMKSDTAMDEYNHDTRDNEL